MENLLKEKIDSLIIRLINEKIEFDKYKDFHGNLLKLGDRVIIGGTLKDQPEMRVYDTRRFLNKIGIIVKLPTLEDDKLVTVKMDNGVIEKFNKNYLEKITFPVDENNKKTSLMFGINSKRINEQQDIDLKGNKVHAPLDNNLIDYIELYSNEKDGFTVEYLDSKKRIVKIEFNKDEYPEAVNLFNQRLKLSDNELWFDYTKDELEEDDLSEM